MKIFISIPMRGRDINEVKTEMSNIMKEYFPNDDMIDTTTMDIYKTSIGYLGRSIIFMEEADMVVFAPGWEKARGCIIEKLVADKYGKRKILIEPVSKADDRGLAKTIIPGKTVSDLIDALAQLRSENTFMICGSDDPHNILTDNFNAFSSIDTDLHIEDILNERL